ncbi:DUF3717 domain-containing protein [Polaromonas sp. P2-4]|nr:DUF3717 domain-containing protein [Polaromonas sp. P2-4]
MADNEQPGFAASFQALNRTLSIPNFPMPGIHITDIEAAINCWRAKSRRPTALRWRPSCALAEVYALMVFYHEDEADERSFPPKALAAWHVWYDTTADTPCIAICSTSQGDEMCKGCGRTFDEVQHWPEMSPVEKRATWRRITLEATAWRFGRYADRALENKEPGGMPGG